MKISLNNIIKILVVIIVLLIIILIVGSQDKAKIELIGEKELTIYQNSLFSDPGYNIIETDKPDEFYVTTDGFVNINSAGIYTIEYFLHSKNGKVLDTSTRKIIVLKDELTNVSMNLIGDEEEYFFVGNYVDHGIEIFRENVDISKDVKIINNVNSDEVGKYEVKYQISNEYVTKETIRRVNIVDYNINENIDYVNLIIDLAIECENYDYVVLPNEKKVYSKYISYEFNDIGEYEFDVYLKSGSHKKYIVNIESIDNSGPVGTCKLYHDNNKTNITMNVSDPSGIMKYSYNGLDFYGNTTMINSIVPSVTIRAYDKRNNYSDIKCTAEYGLNFRNIELSRNGNIKAKISYISYPTNFDNENRELAELMQSYGYKTRGAVAAAGVYLATYKYDVPYFWDGKYAKKGFNPEWGKKLGHTVGKPCSKPLASDNSYCEWGLDCTGYTLWSFVQAGFDASLIRQSDQSGGRWGGSDGKFIASNHRYTFSSSNIAYANQIKPGDIVATPGVHVGLVIGVSDEYIQVANEWSGIKISIIKKSNGASTNNDKSFTHFVLMDEFYRLYGN